MAVAKIHSIEQQSAGSVASTWAPGPDANRGCTEKASLYVGDLDRDVQETHLFNLFSEVRRSHDASCTLYPTGSSYHI